MTKKDPQIENFYALKPSKFGNMESLRIWTNPNIPEREVISDHLNIEMRFLKDGDRSKCLELEFKGISQLKLGELEGMGGYLIFIESIKDNQWDYLKYRVGEEKQSAFSFYCRDFVAKIVNR